MKKYLLMFLVIFLVAGRVEAALVNTGEMALAFGGTGSADCYFEGVYPNCTSNVLTNISGGSYFVIDTVGTFINSDQGIVLGANQSYSAGGPNITETYQWFGDNNTNYSDTAIVAINDGQMDMSGWNMRFGDSPVFFEPGVASISCGDCNIGDSFVLDYYTTVVSGSASGWGGADYYLHLEGELVSTVPLPATFWLFVSGLTGLLGLKLKFAGRNRPV